MGLFTLFDTVTLYVGDGTELLKAANSFYMFLDTSAESLTSSSVSLYSGIAHEVANGNGYTTGGVNLTGVSITRSGNTTSWTYAGPTPKWTASGSGIPAWRWAVIYVNATINGIVKPLIGFVLGDNTPTDVPLTSAGNTIDILASSVINITHSP